MILGRMTWPWRRLGMQPGFGWKKQVQIWYHFQFLEHGIVSHWHQNRIGPISRILSITAWSE